MEPTEHARGTSRGIDLPSTNKKEKVNQTETLANEAPSSMEILLTVLSAWAVYGLCQHDALLPFLGTVIALISFFRRPVVKLERTMRWLTLVGMALLLGWLWRSLLVEDRSDFGLIGIMQTTLVFLSIFVWFQHHYSYRSYALRWMSWMIVALSIDVRFERVSYAMFWIFCLLNISFILIKALMASENLGEPKNQKRKFKIIFSRFCYFTVFLSISFGLFVGLVRFVQLSDKAFMRFIQDYFLLYPHQLLEFGQTLDLRSPGYSGRDIRPIFEIDRKNTNQLYLVTQIFEQYQNGRWEKSPEGPKHPLSNILPPEQEKLNLVLFDQLKGILPAPSRVDAVRNHNQMFEQDNNGIITSPDPIILKATFAMDSHTAPAIPITSDQKRALTQLSPSLQTHLKPYLERIVGQESDPLKVAQTIEFFFRKNFQYSLDINYGADEKGLLGMLKDRKPAYCSYFASAMILMLRERNIPARLKGGFFLSETINHGKQFLARVRDAHAWVEVLVPVEEKNGFYHWVDFDPTPAAARWGAINQGDPLNPLTDWLWRSQRRMRAELVSIDAPQMTTHVLFLFLIFIFLKNYKDLLQGLNMFKRHPKTTVSASATDTQNCLAIYQSFEAILQNKFGIRRQSHQTDEEFLMDLRERNLMSVETISFIGSFIKQYHAVRFGKKTYRRLEDYVQALDGKIKHGKKSRT